MVSPIELVNEHVKSGEIRSLRKAWKGCQGLLLWLWLASGVACGGGRTPVAGPRASSDATWDGGLLSSTAGSVRCGPVLCLPGDKCCLRNEGSPASIGCAPPSGDCLPRTCDETADCDFGQLCCIVFMGSPPVTLGSRCHDGLTCDRLDYIACGSDDDCRAVSAPPCVAQRCRGDVLQSCGPIAFSDCPP